MNNYLLILPWTDMQNTIVACQPAAEIGNQETKSNNSPVPNKVAGNQESKSNQIILQPPNK
jgi:hypothetical protein